MLESRKPQKKETFDIKKSLKDIDVNTPKTTEIKPAVLNSKKEEDLKKIEELRSRLGAGSILGDKAVEEIGLNQLKKEERYNVSGEEQGILYWEDKVKEAEANLKLFESIKQLTDSELKEKYGELAQNVKEEMIPRQIEHNTKILEESRKIVEGLKNKNER